MIIEFIKKYNLNDFEDVKDLVFNSMSGVYKTVNENGETVLVNISNSRSMIVSTYIGNGTKKVNCYNKDGECIEEYMWGKEVNYV